YPVLPSGFGVAESISSVIIFDGGDGLRKTARLVSLGLRDDLVFQFGQRGQQLAHFEWFDDEAIGMHPARFFSLEWFEFTHSQQVTSGQPRVGAVTADQSSG